MRKFLEAALQSGDETTFLNVFQWFQKRRVIPRGRDYEEYMSAYHKQEQKEAVPQ